MKEKVFDDQSLDLPCENCGAKTPKTVAWLKANNEFTCSCGTVITLNRDEFLRDLEKSERDVDKFFGRMKKMFK